MPPNGFLPTPTKIVTKDSTVGVAPVSLVDYAVGVAPVSLVDSAVGMA